MFFLSHGCKHYIGVEADAEEFALFLENREILQRKFPKSRIDVIHGAITKLKVDIEGGEDEMVVETHFPHKWVRSNLLPNATLIQRIFMTARETYYYTLKRVPKRYETLLNMMSVI
jgi:hypothetical protein